MLEIDENYDCYEENEEDQADQQPFIECLEEEEYIDSLDKEQKKVAEANKLGKLLIYEKVKDSLIPTKNNPFNLPVFYIIKFNCMLALKRYFDSIKNDKRFFNIQIVNQPTYNVDETKYKVIRKTYNV